MNDLQTRARTFRELHRSGDPLVLVNAWDAASAIAIATAGGRAVATSSAAMAASLGIPDGPDAPVDVLFDAIARITAVVDVPVSADLFDGYALSGDELVQRLLAAGAVGCNIEDSDHRSAGALLDVDTVVDRLHDIRAAASRAGVDIVLNARIDCLIHMPDADAAMDEIIRRGRRYVEAGADSAFPVRVSDASRARRIVDSVDGFVNGSWNPNASITELASAGVHRISMGPQAHGRVLDALETFARPLLVPGGPR
jgi:2-methylisocitrate lyase-like PEP mutase family enzyme